MGILATIDNQIMRAEAESYGPSHDFWYGDIEAESDSGIRISEKGALRISTVYKCADWYFRMFGHTPKNLMERVEMFGKPASREAVDHDLYEMIHDAPNPRMSAALFWGLAAVDMKLNGNFYAFIQRSANGRPKYLFRIDPRCVEPKKIKGSDGKKQLWNFVQGDDGLPVKFYPDEIFHVRGMGDELAGYSPIKLQMNLLGWNRATARYGSQFFKNASRPSGIISTPTAISNKNGERDAILANLSRSGKEAGKLVLIEGAVTYHKLTLDQDEAQFVLTYQQQEEDIAGVMGVSPHEIGINRNINNSITEQQTINSVTRYLTPFCVLFEQAMKLQLLSDAPSSGRGGGTERSRYFFQSELKILLRGDTAAQTAHLTAMIDRAVYSPNQALGYLGESPVEDGDVRVINRAYGPLDMIREWSKVSQNNPSQPRQADSEPEDDKAASSKAVAMLAFKNGFRDCAGRLMSRKKDRASYAVAIFGPILRDMAGLMQCQMGAEFETRYLEALGMRSIAWQESRGTEAIAEEELSRAVEALSGRVSS